MLFYSPRKKENVSHKKKKKKEDQITKELGKILETMGIETTFEEVQKALDKIYPEGTEGEEQGVVTRELFRYFKKKESN